MLPRVICIGSTSKDLFFPTDEGVIMETPEDLTAQTKVAFELGGKFRVKDRFEALGGVAANVATGLARLGLVAHCYSKVGRDEIGDWISHELERNEVRTDTLFRDPQVKSDVSAIVVITQAADRIIFHNRDANEKLEILSESLPQAEWLFVSALNGPWQENFKRVLDLKRKRHLHLALNPGQHNLKEDPEFVMSILHEVDVLVLNKDEAIEILLKSKTVEETDPVNDESFLLRKLHEIGVPRIGMTDGRRGAWGYDGETVLHADVHERQGLVDTTGAGDAFGSGFFAATLYSLPLSTALQYGIANGGSVVGHFGAIKGLLTQAEIQESLPKIKVEHVVSIK